jgi:acyl carrier protein
VTESDIRTHLKSWIAKHSKSSSIADIRDDTPILEQGILSSLDIVELVLYIENLRGEEIDAEEIDPEAFVSIDSLYENFFRIGVTAA